MRIAVIGAGPVGGHAAYCLAKKGYEVLLFEEHDEAGKHFQCTGLMTVSMEEVTEPMKDFLVNQTESLDVISPQGEKLSVESKEYVVSRKLFDQYVVKKAVEAGAKIFYSHHFERREENNLFFTNRVSGEEVSFVVDKVVGADGPTSKVAQESGMYGEREFYHGVQVRARGSFDKTSFQTYFGNKIAPKLFAWVVPEDENIARIGLGTRQEARSYLNKFLEEKKYEVIDYQGGLIPVYNPKQVTEKGDTYLVGDAATQVKATTLGGIIPGMKAAECLAEAIDTGKSYEKLWKTRIGKSLWLHLQIRKALDRFTDEDFDLLIRAMNNDKAKKILQANDREKPFKLLPILLTNPRLLWLTRRAFVSTTPHQDARLEP